MRKTYQRGEDGFRNTLSTGSAVNVKACTSVTYVYRCPNCHREITYEDQVRLAKIQAQAGSKVLPISAPVDLPPEEES